jgi:hypothetical protein
VSNDELRSIDLPRREQGQMAWIEFALTFNGYEAKGGFDAEECADGASRQEQLRADSLRSAA